MVEKKLVDIITEKKSATTAVERSTMKIVPSMFYEVFYKDLESTVVKQYGNASFEYLYDQHLPSTDDDPLFFEVRKGSFTEDEFDEIAEFKSDGDYSYITILLLKDLANKNLIPEGDYLVFTFNRDSDRFLASQGNSLLKEAMKKDKPVVRSDSSLEK